MLLYVNVLTSTELTVDKFVLLSLVVKFLTRSKRHDLVATLKVLFTFSTVAIVTSDVGGWVGAFHWLTGYAALCSRCWLCLGVAR